MTTPTGLPTYPAVAAVSGLLLAAAALPCAPALAVPLVAATGLLALAGLRFRPAASAAVVTTAVALTLGDPTAVLAVAAGLIATVYLLSVHAIGQPPGVVLGPATFGGALGFSGVALLASLLPSGQPWWPVIAPVSVVLLYLCALYPTSRRSGGR